MMTIVTGDAYVERLWRFVEEQTSALLDGSVVLKLNPAGLHYVQSRMEALAELEALRASAPLDYLRAYVSDLGDYRALERLRRILRLLTSLKVVSVLQLSVRDPTPVSLLPFAGLRVLELRGCDLSTSPARGLLQLRPILRKLVCHNSTDALRHVFTDRIAEIRNCPHWIRLSIVSCASNALLLMDESLSLLPTVETLDLSRNLLSKVDNLRQCEKLRHLDLGFNRLRTISSLAEVACPITKLVLKNNALTSLRGIENLKKLEALDVSYNIISSFLSIEILGGLPRLQNLLLEGNPLCYSRWYRPRVYSYFSNPEGMTLDGRKIGKTDFWKVQLICSRRKMNPRYGFFRPATEAVEQNENFGAKCRKLSHIAHIEDSLEMEVPRSTSVDQDLQSEDAISDKVGKSKGETEALGLMHRAELMKKEKSAIWLKEFSSTLDCNTGVQKNRSNSTLVSRKENNLKIKQKSKQRKDDTHFSHDESSVKIIESDAYVTSIAKNVQSVVSYAEADGSNRKPDGINIENSSINLDDTVLVSRSNGNSRQELFSSLTSMGDIMELRHSANQPSSPPHYQEDLMLRLQSLDEEFVQLATDSCSTISSYTDTSTSEGSCFLYDSLSPTPDRLENGNTWKEEASTLFSDEFFEKTYHTRWHGCPGPGQDTKLQEYSYPKPASENPRYVEPYWTNGTLPDFCDTNQIIRHDRKYLDEKNMKKMPGRSIFSLSRRFVRDRNNKLQLKKQNNAINMTQSDIEENYSVEEASSSEHHVSAVSKTETDGCTILLNDGFIRSYFTQNIAKDQGSEICQEYVCCSTVQPCLESSAESEVCIILSSKSKFYVLLVSAADQDPGLACSSLSSGLALEVLACDRVEDIKEIIVGIGLLVFRVHVAGNKTYLFVTKTVDKSKELLGLLLNCECIAGVESYSLRSWEQVQVNFLGSDIYGELNRSILFYSMLLIWHENRKGQSWSLRSIFLVGGYILICKEDLLQFGALDPGTSAPYFSLDACCSISDILEMVVDCSGSGCVTLALNRVAAPGKISPAKKREQMNKENQGGKRWRLKWFCEQDLLKFVVLVRALFGGTTTSPLTVKYAS